MRQPQIQFARSSDETRIAYALTGEGPPLVRASHWLGNLDFDWQTPVWGPWIAALSERYHLLRYDSRGCGLSDREAEDITIDGLVADLECVVDKAGIDRFALLGMSQGGAVSIVYAARHPERVSHLLLCGAFARGPLCRNPSPQQVEATEAMIVNSSSLVGSKQSGVSADVYVAILSSRRHWPKLTRSMKSSVMRPRPARRHVSSGLSPSSMRRPSWHACRRPLFGPLHSRGDNRVPFEEGRFIATSIAGARFEPLDSNSHVPLPGEPAFQRFLDDITAFVPPSKAGVAPFTELTRREREVLDQVARGLDNAQIAARLDLAEKTVRNYITAIFDKMAVENRSQAIVAARVAGLGGP